LPRPGPTAGYGNADQFLSTKEWSTRRERTWMVIAAGGCADSGAVPPASGAPGGFYYTSRFAPLRPQEIMLPLGVLPRFDRPGTTRRVRAPNRRGSALLYVSIR